MIISRALLLAATAAACPGASRAETIVHGAPGSGDNLPQFQLNWSDEFDQGYAATGYPLNNAPDPTVWDRNYFGVSTWYKGQVNPDDETQIYMDRPENVRVEDGALVLELRADGRTAHPGFNDRNGNLDDLHTSGHVVSKAGAKTFSRVGRIEFRAKIPSVGIVQDIVDRFTQDIVDSFLGHLCLGKPLGQSSSDGCWCVHGYGPKRVGPI